MYRQRQQICDMSSTVKHFTAYKMQIFLIYFSRNLSLNILDRNYVQQNLTERKRCKFNSAVEMCLYGHIIRYGYEHIILVHVSFILIPDSKYRIVYFV